MQLLEGEIVLSATDLTGFLECEHLTQLELKAAKGELVRPVRDDPELDILTRRGGEHEAAHLARLRGEGRSVVEISTASGSRAELYAREAETLAAMRAGADVIYQATFFDGRWRGHADFLLRVERPGDLGDWSYEVADTKLARKVKTAALLQMSNYSEQLARIQGTYPAEMHVVLGTGVTETFAVNDFAAYYRAVKARYEAAVTGPEQATYPDPVEHCGVCRWRDVCVARRRADDHLSLVAGMRRDVTRKLVENGISTVASLAALAPEVEVDRVGGAVLDKLRRQAQLQLQQRESGRVQHELLPVQPGLGLGLLPAPSAGDLFFDMEGDPFAGEHGLEYLFGVVEVGEGTPAFRSWWGHDAAEEKAAFEGFMDFAMARLRVHTDLHIYHYAAYEPSRLKSLMGRYGTREEDVDRLLRGGVLVDLYQVVRQSVRISQESYSIKKLEPLYMGARQAEIADAGSSIVAYEQWLETKDPAQLEAIERYNEEDCVSTWLLRNWLEDRRLEAEATLGTQIERPVARDPAPSERQAAAEAQTATLAAALTDGVPEDPARRTPDQRGRWLLAQLLGWHKREARSQWWDYFRRLEMTDADLVADSEAIGQLQYEGEVGFIKRSLIHRYRFDPTQLHKIGVGDAPHDPRTGKVAGTVHAIDNLAGTVDLTRGMASTVPHPTSLIPESPRSSTEQRMAIERVAQSAIDLGLGAPGAYRALGDLLARHRPHVTGTEDGKPLDLDGETMLDAARRIARDLDGSYLPVQGPPGSGKTWVGARMIVELVRQGRRVGIAATSHKAICNLMEAVCEHSEEMGVDIRAMQRAPEDQRCSADIVTWAKDNPAVDAAIASGEVDVVAGTAWLFARAALDGAFDTIFIDEAGQMSLADVVAIGTSARNIVLLGDPQQLAHPSQGVHPPGSGASALDHILDGRQTLSRTDGLFLETTFRMHPDVCSFISEIAYEGRLNSHSSCATQSFEDVEPIGGTGIRHLPVDHHGNRTVSREEITVVSDLVSGLIGRSWTDNKGQSRSLQVEDILVMAPYNAQVDRLQVALPSGCAAGTVDRFQGQEAPVVIYSLATSTPEDMPRQMEFLYSLNRLNVAISRARGLAILVCSPELLRIRCRRPEQMRLANAFCRLVEHATSRIPPSKLAPPRLTAMVSEGKEGAAADLSTPSAATEPAPVTSGGISEAGVRLEDLTPGATLRGVTPGELSTVVAVRWHGSNAITLTFRDPGGGVHERLLYRDHEASLNMVASAAAYAFDGDPGLFRVAAEALRIRMAARFDPMLAVSTSDLDPLPHQIKAVYGELLPRTPLRYLLADDPGAGKTIMAGLYIKELLLRGDLARCMIVAPGSLVDQWQEELLDKFALRFELLTRSMIDEALDGGVFDRHPLLIARMDQLSRDEDLQARMEQSDWDLIVVDEAHRMSAHYYGAELKTTKRYDLGRILGKVARHLLLMTATPHAGKEEDFQLFMALLDSDRFEGRYRDAVHSIDTEGLMRRMIKEDLYTFDGKPLFPERFAYTVPYQLSEGEQQLYEAVTQYVREQMSRAERLKAAGEGRRGNTVGFALTILQRRLASSPEAILRSLERRRKRLEQTRQDSLAEQGAGDAGVKRRLAELLGRTADLDGDSADDLTGEELENSEEDVVDAASAATTIAELDAEIAILADLEELARRVRHAGTDKKWTELRTLLLDQKAMYEPDGTRRKIIIFTEHRDTLNYLEEKIRSEIFGKDEPVVSIHGGVRREQRRAIQELFRQDKDTVVLVATDAAGEGLNLQRAHLMVNYDLPWNPNRIEQRFGRIHRIGQEEVCHLWNLVATETREGAVFQRLLEKMEEQRRAYKGRIFDVLGESFEGKPLRDLLIEAIRYGDQPEVRDRLNKVIDDQVAEGLDQLLSERALFRDGMADADVQELRLHMEEARARRLQPFYVQAFFTEAFKLLGGRMSARETGRFEITHVPAEVRDRDRQVGIGGPVLRKYERICFEREHVRDAESVKADLVAPGHPLLDSVLDLMIDRHGVLLKQGTILIDGNDLLEEPRLMVAVSQEIHDGHRPPRTVSKRFDFVEIGRGGEAASTGPAPYLDYRPPTAEEAPLLSGVATEAWLAGGPEDIAVNWAVEHGVSAHLSEVEVRVKSYVTRARSQVKQRLTQEINYWDARHADLLDQQAAGKQLKIRPETAEKRARDLERRLEKRMGELAADESLGPLPPVIAGGALVVPQGMVARLAGQRDQPVATYAKETAEVDRRAVAAVMAAEKSLGREPHEMSHNNPGYDIRSLTPDGHWVFIEVKGRILGADDFSVTRNEVLYGKNADRYRLALVSVHPDGPEREELRYLTDPFKGLEFGDFAADAVRGSWHDMWERGGAPS